MDSQIYQYIDGQMDRCRDAEIDGWIDAEMQRQMDGQIDRCIEQMYGYLVRLIDRQIDSWIIQLKPNK